MSGEYLLLHSKWFNNGVNQRRKVRYRLRANVSFRDRKVLWILVLIKKIHRSKLFVRETTSVSLGEGSWGKEEDKKIHQKREIHVYEAKFTLESMSKIKSKRTRLFEEDVITLKVNFEMQRT